MKKSLAKILGAKILGANITGAKIIGSGFLLLALTGSGASLAQAGQLISAGLPADLIMTNGHIKTSSGWVEAMAIRNGVIVALGDAKTVKAAGGPKTKMLDLGGDTVLPGLHDVHVHPIYAGISEVSCKIAQGSNLKDTLQKVKACAQAAAPGKWVTGGQWDASALGQVPNRSQLDAVSAGHPVLLEDTSGHSNWVNSKALELAGMAKKTPNPEGGIIERDAAGEPTGILRETATDMISKFIPKPTEQEAQTALAWSLHKMLSYGITSFTEAAVGFTAGAPKELAAYAALADSKVLKTRTRLCITWAPGSKEADETVASRNLYARDRLSPDCVKIFLDGVPTDSHTAAMLEPYVGTVKGRSDEASRMGLLLVKQDILDQAVTRFDKMGLTVKFHAAGDAAVRAGLNAIAAARAANGFSAQMHNIGHCTFVAKEDIARARAAQATFEVSPYLWAPSPINDDITTAVGNETIKRVWPVREMVASGALVVPGSDWSVVPSVNPWIGLETLVTREVPGGSQKSFGKAEAITFAQAFDLFTVNSAKQEGMASKVGRIEAGMLADVIVVNQNPFDVPVTKIHDTKVKMTFINGEKVYDLGSQKVTAP
jgi:predicted amidohydrolase YtcJ